jgi:hypothetical protein
MVCQAEEFLVIQNGVELPLFWDGSLLWRSLGIISVNNVHGNPPAESRRHNEIPIATCMEYWQEGFEYAQGRTYGAGDIVYGAAEPQLQLP